MRWLIYGGFVYSFCLYWANIPVTSIFCAPAPGQPWSIAVGLKCKPAAVFGVIQGTLNVALDIYILLLPVHVVLNLQLPMHKKLGVLAVFMTGVL